MTATIVPLPALPTPADERPHLVAHPVCTVGDALAMGFIRDARRDGFSRDTTPIDGERQIRWWHEQRERVRAFLYRDGAGALIGYGALLQRPDGRWVSSCAVLGQFEGRGWGRAILHHLVNSVEHEVYAQARNDNEAAVALHNPGDWQCLGADNDNTYFRTWPRVRPAAPSLAPDDYAGSLGR